MIATRRISFNFYDKPCLFSLLMVRTKLGYFEVINPAFLHQLQLGFHHFLEIILVIPNSGELGLEIDARQNLDKGAPICWLEMFQGVLMSATSNVGDAMKKQSMQELKIRYHENAKSRKVQEDSGGMYTKCILILLVDCRLCDDRIQTSSTFRSSFH